MAKEKPVFTHKFDIGDAMATPWNMPGGRNFLVRIVLWGTALMLLSYAIFGRKFISAYADLLIANAEVQNADGDAVGEAATEMMSQMGGFFASVALMSLFSWMVMISVETAMHKNVFRGTDHGAFPLRFGRDELRVLLAQLVIGVIIFLVYILSIVFLSVLIGGVIAVGGGFVGLAIILGIVGFVAFIVLMVRLIQGWGPAAAMSVRDDKQRIFDGWPLAQGRNWPVFGTFLVVGLLGYILIYVIMIMGMFASFGNMDFLIAMSGLESDPAALFETMGEAIKTPRVMIPLVFFTILYFIAAMLWYLHIWGIYNYIVQLDSKEKGLM